MPLTDAYTIPEAWAERPFADFYRLYAADGHLHLPAGTYAFYAFATLNDVDRTNLRSAIIVEFH